MSAIIVAGAAVGNFPTASEVQAEEASIGRTAGVISSLHDITANAFTDVTIEENEVAEVSTAVEEADPEWANKLTANVDEYLSIRDGASTENALVGKLRRGDVAEIVSEQDGWYEINSGNAHGYVSAEFALVGDEAKAFLNEICTTYAVSNTDGLRVREQANTESAILTTMQNGDKFAVDTEAEAVEGWIAVKTNYSKGYVSAEFASVSTEYGAAITIEEEQAAIAAQKAAEEAAAAEAAAKAAAQASTTVASQSTGSTAVQGSSVSASYSDVQYLAAIIQHEAGSTCYEGQLAVGAVVVNRMKDPRFPSTVYDVINQKNQFISTSDPSMVKILNNLAPSSIQAAQQALSGYDITGGCLSFRSAWTGHAGTNIGGNIFF